MVATAPVYLPVGLGLTSSDTRASGSARGYTCACWTRGRVRLWGIIDDPMESPSCCQRYQIVQNYLL